MSMIEINWNPKKKELRTFGIAALAAAALLSLLLYLLKHPAIHWIVIINSLGIIVFLCSLVSARVTRIIYLGMTLLTYPIGFAISFLILAAFYFLIITPVGFVFRLTGKDPLLRNFDHSAKSYWLKRQPPDKLERYYHQF